MKWPHFTDKKTEAQRFETTDRKVSQAGGGRAGVCLHPAHMRREKVQRSRAERGQEEGVARLRGGGFLWDGSPVGGSGESGAGLGVHTHLPAGAA